MSRLVKTGLIGMGITATIAVLLFITASVSFNAIIPFFMPWSVLLLIGFTNRKK